VSKNKKALRRFPGHRARFCYDDLLGLFSYEYVQVQIGFLRPFLRQPSETEFRVKAALHSLPEVPLLIAGLQHAAILHHDAKPARKVKRAQKPLHGCGKNLG
jgi:hypothetical protein